MTNVLPDRSEATINLAPHRLRLFEERQRINPAYLHSAETIILDVKTGQPYHLPNGIMPLGHLPMSGPDTWIFDVTGELQEPPTGPVPPLPPPPPDPQPTGARPAGFRPGHRRRLAPLVKGVLIGAGLVAAVYSGLIAAAWVVLP